MKKKRYSENRTKIGNERKPGFSLDETILRMRKKVGFLLNIASGSKLLTFRLEVRDGNNASDTAEVTVKIRELRDYHSADYNPPDHKIKLSELLRVIQFYNIKAAYSCDPDGKDGYGFGEDDMTCSSDYAKADQSREDRRINLSDLLRIIQFYNSSGYHADPNGEDGFAPDK